MLTLIPKVSRYCRTTDQLSMSNCQTVVNIFTTVNVNIFTLYGVRNVGNSTVTIGHEFNEYKKCLFLSGKRNIAY